MTVIDNNGHWALFIVVFILISIWVNDIRKNKKKKKKQVIWSSDVSEAIISNTSFSVILLLHQTD